VVRASRHPVAGTGWPGLISLCTRRGKGVHDFAAVYRRGRAVVVDTEGADFNRLVISCADASAKAQMIEAASASYVR
jgi:hypothetical protein